MLRLSEFSHNDLPSGVIMLAKFIRRGIPVGINVDATSTDMTADQSFGYGSWYAFSADGIFYPGTYDACGSDRDNILSSAMGIVGPGLTIKGIRGNLVPVFADGGDHEVEALLGV